MDDPGTSKNISRLTIFDVLEVDVCRRAILGLVHIRDIVRSERVSRRWQRAVLGYLQHCRSVTLWCSRRPPSFDRSGSGVPYNGEHWDFLPSGSLNTPRRTINIEYYYKICSHPAILKKMGASISRFKLDFFDMKLLKMVALHCRNLRDLEFQTAHAKRELESEVELGKLFAVRKLENISITYGVGMKGEFFSVLKHDLESLELACCKSINYEILSQARCMRNIKTLKIHDYTDTWLRRAPPLLNKTSKLTTLHLTRAGPVDVANDEIINCFRSLVNLKSLKVKYFINEALLEALRCCKKLECLEIIFGYPLSFSRGLAALVMRNPPGPTWFSFKEDISMEKLKDFNKKLYESGLGKVRSEIVEVPRVGCPLQKELRLVFRPVGTALEVHDLRIHLAGLI